MPHLDHIGIAIRDASDTERLFQQLFGFTGYKQETVPHQHVETTFLSAGSTKLELLESSASDSVIDRYLDRHGEGIHHLAFQVDDILDAMERVRAYGLDPLQETPEKGADGKELFFLHPRQTHGILIEFCEDTKPPLEPAYMSFRGERLATYSAGNPAHPSIVLLHGALGATELETYHLLKDLERDFYVVAFDMPGHGASDDIADLPLTLEGLVEVVVALLEKLNLQEVTLFGFSFAGNAALTLARRHPSAVERIIIHAANPFWRSSETSDLFDPTAIERDRPSWARRLDLVHGAQQWRRTCTRLIKAAETREGTFLADEEIRAVRRPVLVTGGDRDPLTPLSATTRVHQLLPESQLAILPNSAHPLQHVDAVTYGRMIRSFVENDTDTSG